MTNEQKAEKIAKLWGPFGAYAYNAAIDMAEWKDEQFNEERKELLGLVKMLPVNENNQTIIEDLIGMLE